MARRRAKQAQYPAGSAFNNVSVRAAYKAIADAAKERRESEASIPQFIRQNGAALAQAKAAHAMQLLAVQAQQAVDVQFSRGSGSAYQSDKVQRALEGLQGVQMTQAEGRRPDGSAYQSDKVQRALEGLQGVRGGVVGLSDFKHTSGSITENEKVAQGLTGLTRTGDSGQVGASMYQHSDGSYFSDQSVLQAAKAASNTKNVEVPFKHESPTDPETLSKNLNALENVNKNAAIGVSQQKRPTASAIDECLIESIQALSQTMQNASVGATDKKHRTGTIADTPDVAQGVQNLGKAQGANASVGTSHYQHKSSSSITEKTAPKIDEVGKMQVQNASLYFAVNALNGGEISPDMLARIDQPRYMTGCEYLLNMVPIPQGGLTKRPGLVYVTNKGNAIVKIYPFVFSAEESGLLIFTAANSGSSVRVSISYPYWSETTLNISGFPLKGGDLADIQMVQSADVIYFCHPSHRPGKLMRYGRYNWRYEDIKFLPSIDTPTGITLEGAGELSGSDSNKSQQWYDYKITAIDGETGEESLPSEWTEASHVKTYPLSDSWCVHITWDAVPGASSYRIYKKSAGVFGFIGISENTTFDDYNITADTEDTPPNAKDPFVGSGNYPSVCFLHQQRLGFACTANKPLTMWMSQAGNYESMASSVPPEDDDAIEVTLASSQANRIIWCQTDRKALAVGTAGGEWVLQGSDGGAITPSDLSFQPQTSHGSQDGKSPAIWAGSNLVYLQRGGKVVREFNYSFQSDKYESGDLCLLSRHLLQDRKIVSWAYQADPYGIIWCVLNDGTFLGLTYMKEHDVVAWHRHETNGTVEDCAAIPMPDGSTRVYFVVSRGDNQRCIEYLDKFFTGGEKDGANHLDGINKQTFSARCIPTLPETQIRNGSTFLHVRKINAVKFRVINSAPFKVQVGEDHIYTVPVRGADYTQQHRDWAVPLGSGWREDDRLQIICDGPDPVTILGMETAVEVADMSGGQK